MQLSEPLSPSSVAVLPGEELAASRGRSTQEIGFPLLLLFATWMALFPLQNAMDAPLTWFDEQSAADLAQVAQQGNSLARVVIVIFGAVGVWLVIRYRYRLSFCRPLAIPALTYFAWNLLSGIWADQPALAMRRLISLALMLLFASGLALRMKPKQLSMFIAAIPSLNLLPGIFAELRSKTFHPFDADFRFVGTAVHPNVQAATLAFAFLFWFWQTCQAASKARVLYACATVFVGIFLLLTGSRTAIVAVVMAVLFSLVLMVVRFRTRWIFPALALLSIVLGCAALGELCGRSLLGNGSANALHAHGDEGGPTSFNGRVAVWQSLFPYLRERPVLGYGYGSFWSPERIESVSEDQGWAIQQSHSAYLDQALALGIPGGLLYVSVLLINLAVCARRYVNGYDGYGAWAAVLAFVCIHNFTESINISPVYTNFAFNLLLLHNAFIQPPLSRGERFEASPNGRVDNVSSVVAWTRTTARRGYVRRFHDSTLRWYTASERVVS